MRFARKPNNVTNVTFLPWVDPEQTPSVLSPAPAGERTASEPEVPEGVARLSSVLFVDAESEAEESAASLDIDALEQSLLRKLNSQDMSVLEVMQWLASKDAAESDAAELVAKFERLNYLNDERLASELVSRLSERKGKSKSVISRELRQRGISTAVIENALALIDDEDELHKATELALGRVRQFSRLDDETAERRLFGFLTRRGYSGQIVREACKVALATRS